MCPFFSTNAQILAEHQASKHRVRGQVFSAPVLAEAQNKIENEQAQTYASSEFNNRKRLSLPEDGTVDTKARKQQRLSAPNISFAPTGLNQNFATLGRDPRAPTASASTANVETKTYRASTADQSFEAFNSKPMIETASAVAKSGNGRKIHLFNPAGAEQNDNESSPTSQQGNPDDSSKIVQKRKKKLLRKSMAEKLVQSNSVIQGNISGNAFEGNQQNSTHDGAKVETEEGVKKYGIEHRRQSLAPKSFDSPAVKIQAPPMVDLHYYDDMNADQLRIVLKNLKARVEEQVSQERKTEYFQETIEKLLSKNSKLENQLNDLLRIKSEFDKVDLEIKTTRQDLTETEKLQDQLEKAESEKERLRDYLAGITDEKSKLDNKIFDFARCQKKYIEDILALKSALKKAKNVRTEAVRESERLQAEVDNLQSELSVEKSNIYDMKKKIGFLEGYSKNHTENLQKAHAKMNMMMVNAEQDKRMIAVCQNELKKNEVFSRLFVDIKMTAKKIFQEDEKLCLNVSEEDRFENLKDEEICGIIKSVLQDYMIGKGELRAILSKVQTFGSINYQHLLKEKDEKIFKLEMKYQELFRSMAASTKNPVSKDVVASPKPVGNGNRKSATKIGVQNYPISAAVTANRTKVSISEFNKLLTSRPGVNIQLQQVRTIGTQGGLRMQAPMVKNNGNRAGLNFNPPQGKHIGTRAGIDVKAPQGKNIGTRGGTNVKTSQGKNNTTRSGLKVQAPQVKNDGTRAGLKVQAQQVKIGGGRAGLRIPVPPAVNVGTQSRPKLALLQGYYFEK